MPSQHIKYRVILLGSLLIAAARQTSTLQAHPMEWSQILALPQPAADSRESYGPAPSQYGELRLPKGSGPFQVVVLLHGGCWSAEYSLDHARNLAGAITQLGFATWLPEYRRLGEAGAGWPGTFLDVGAAFDHLRVLAKRVPLDLQHVTAVGHSAGGHLALWAAARGQLAKGSELAAPAPMPVQAVVALAAISDLKTYSLGTGACNAATPRLFGGTFSEQRARYLDGLPPPPKNVPLYFVHGDQDAIVPIEQSRSFVAQRHREGAAATLLEIAGAGHFDVIASTSEAYKTVARAVQAAVKAAPTASRPAR